MKKLFTQKQKDQDYTKYFGEMPTTTKQRLLEECGRNDVSICLDDSTEQSSGYYAAFRGVASEAELERRINAKKVISQSNRANAIAVTALIVSIVALVKSYL